MIESHRLQTVVLSALGIVFGPLVGSVVGVVPDSEWQFVTPGSAGMNTEALDVFRDYVGGCGCVVRNDCMVYTWGDQAKRADVASAAKPVVAHFVWKALENKRLSSLDAKVVEYASCLADLNPELANKDRLITFRHLVTQTSCYGVTERPGTAFCYSDWQMALLWDTLFLSVYQSTHKTVDDEVLRPLLTGVLRCQDDPTFLAFGRQDRPGRLAISVRDFARFGLLYLHEGRWGDKQVLERTHAIEAVTRPLPNSLPRTSAKPAQMCPDARSYGSKRAPDDQCDHLGSYSYLWWTNGKDRDGRRHWPHAPVDAFG